MGSSLTIIAKTYAAWDMTTASQMLVREVTPELIRTPT